MNSAREDELWRRRQRSLAACCLRTLDAELFLTGRTAAAIWGLPIFGVATVPRSGAASSKGQEPIGSTVAQAPRSTTIASSASLTARLDDTVEAGSFDRDRRVRRTGLRVHRLSPRLTSVVRVSGFAVTDPATTWAMLAPRVSLRDAIVLGDAVLHTHRIPGTTRVPKHALATINQLRSAALVPYRLGRATLLDVLPRLSAHSASPPETDLPIQLIAWDAPPFELDVDVLDSDGSLAGCGEIAFRDYRLAVEYEGNHHLTDTRQWNRDIEKYQDYSRLGWEVIRVTADLLYRRPDELRRQIFEALARRRNPLTSPRT